jgi:peptidoglycan hydrolase-like protein with peptidoglycan-binding domain
LPSKTVALALSIAALACGWFADVAVADGGGLGTGGSMIAANGEVMLKRGDRGPAVRILQRRLGIAADGVFGPMTERAVKRYQRGHGLVPDGVVGPITRGSLGLEPFRANSVNRSMRMPRVMRRIAECESGGDPRAVSKTGRYRGKYQFTRETWRNLGGQGDPAEAPEWLQDRLALKLYRLRGTAPWPACARSRSR